MEGGSVNVTRPVLRAGEIPGKWYSEKRLTSLRDTREGASSEMRGRSPGPREPVARGVLIRILQQG